VDAYNELEQRMGFYTMLEENLGMPFLARIPGVSAAAERVDLADDDRIIAICRRSSSKQAEPILKLPLPTPHPAGADPIDAYRLWTRPR
jgi:hypothetical protein